MRTEILNEENLPEPIEIGKAKNLINNRFGRLVVLYRCNPPNRIKNKTQTYWVCQCDCGNKIQARTGALVTNGLQSCGCIHSEIARKNMEAINSTPPWNKQDLIGKRFNKLLVIEGYSRNQKSYWRCKCDCGGYREVETYNLTHNKVLHCGCESRSNGELLIHQWLIRKGFYFLTEYTFADLKDTDCLRFDFAIFKNDQLFCLLEYHGVQHFDKNNNWYDESLVQRDRMKREYCKKSNIPLYEITYLDIIEDKLEDFFCKEGKEK